MARKPGERDYRDLKQAGAANPDRRPMAGGRTRDWWNKSGAECADVVKDTVALLVKNQQVRMRQLAVSIRLYGNLSLSGAGGTQYARLPQSQTATKDRITYCAAQSCVDTVVAKIGENKPRPFYLTSGGSYRQQRKAKQINKWVEGTFYENKTYDVGLAAFRDAAILGDGLVHVYGRAGKIWHERVLCADLWVDEVEGQYGNPANMHWYRVVDRDQLIGAFPDKRKEIEGASRSVDASVGGATNVSDMVGVVESWHLGAMNEKGEYVGGKHCICLTSATSTGRESSVMLVEPEDWPHPWFPFARVSWAPKPIGYWAQGLMERLQGSQLELNKTAWLIQRSFHMAGSFKILVSNGSKIVKESLNNDIGTVITHTGPPPQYVTTQPIDAMYLSREATIIERMYREAGVSEMSASSKKPAGLNSGRALREAEDIESDRFKTIQRHNDNLYLQLAEISLGLAQEMSEHGKLKPVRVPQSRGFMAIDWKKDIGGVHGDEYVLQCFPVSRLPRDPAGRLQTIQEYIQAGFMTPRQGRRALDFPDLDAVESLANAQEDVITKTLDAIVDEGEYAPPEPTDDLGMCKEMAIEYIQRYRLLDLEDERLDMLRRYSAQVDQLMGDAAAAVAPQMAAEGGPQAAPLPPPTSDLLPNAPGMAA
jgi:hypothetical protein